MRYVSLVVRLWSLHQIALVALQVLNQGIMVQWPHVDGADIIRSCQLSDGSVFTSDGVVVHALLITPVPKSSWSFMIHLDLLEEMPWRANSERHINVLVEAALRWSSYSTIFGAAATILWMMLFSLKMMDTSSFGYLTVERMPTLSWTTRGGRFLQPCW